MVCQLRPYSLPLRSMGANYHYIRATGKRRETLGRHYVSCLSSISHFGVSDTTGIKFISAKQKADRLLSSTPLESCTSETHTYQSLELQVLSSMVIMPIGFQKEFEKRVLSCLCFISFISECNFGQDQS